ncbi:MAG TPA: SMC-Scp complex subunit ScpB [Opitutaceae bacterium]|nr:SMC-Scp complex subunit ScpB [Opitutaceae bacterium]
MAFNLKLVLKALLFSSNRPLSIQEIQDTFTRFHAAGRLAPGLPASGEATPAGGDGTGAGPEVPTAPGGPAAASRLSAADEELYRDVPALVTMAQIREALNELTLELRAADDVYLLTETAQGFRLVTQPRFARWVRILRDEPLPVKLSQPAMETLAVIAYRQPVTRAEIEHIRGVSADAGLSRLLERELIAVVGRADLPGRPIQYGTTEAFLDFIGARSLDELPASDVLSQRQIDGWLQSAMNPAHPSDREMGLSEEGEEQLSLDDAARAARAKEFPPPAAAPGSAEPAPAGGAEGGVFSGAEPPPPAPSS